MEYAPLGVSTIYVQGRPLRVHEYTIVPPWLLKNDNLTLKGMFSASRSFLNFENRTIIKEDMAKKVSEGQIFITNNYYAVAGKARTSV